MNLKETNSTYQHKEETITVLFKTKDVNRMFGALIYFFLYLTSNRMGTGRKLFSPFALIPLDRPSSLTTECGVRGSPCQPFYVIVCIVS